MSWLAARWWLIVLAVECHNMETGHDTLRLWKLGGPGSCWSGCEPSILFSVLCDRLVGMKKDRGKSRFFQLEFPSIFFNEVSNRLFNSWVESCRWCTTWLGPVCCVIISSFDILYHFLPSLIWSPREDGSWSVDIKKQVKIKIYNSNNKSSRLLPRHLVETRTCCVDE